MTNVLLPTPLLHPRTAASSPLMPPASGSIASAFSVPTTPARSPCFHCSMMPPRASKRTKQGAPTSESPSPYGRPRPRMPRRRRARLRLPKGEGDLVIREPRPFHGHKPLMVLSRNLPDFSHIGWIRNPVAGHSHRAQCCPNEVLEDRNNI